ncbi:efflux RND transporter periplasmic adaptor subunit [bacterium]|nr:efflux RND transporter periplasmic adaptor subunit [bacterium]
MFLKKNIISKISLLIILATYLVACSNSQNNHSGHNHASAEDEHNHEGHDHSEDETSHDHDAHSQESTDDHSEHAQEETHDHSSHAEESVSDHSAHNHDEEEHAHDTNMAEEAKHNHDDNEIHQVIVVKKAPFCSILKTGGDLLPLNQNQKTIVATHDGLVQFSFASIYQGVKVEINETLMAISAVNTAHDNLYTQSVLAKENFNNADKNYQRALKLKKDTLISEQEFIEIELTYKTAASKWKAFNKNNQNRALINSPTKGYIKDVFVEDGQYVKVGDPIISIAQTHRLVLKADINPNDVGTISEIKSANFRTSGGKKFWNTKDLNGKVISRGQFIDHTNFYTPLYIEIDNPGDLTAGAYAEIYLKSSSSKEVISVPKSAIMEEQGSYYVFALHGEDFERTDVTLGDNDGVAVEVLSGLHVGDQIATHKVTNIKLSKRSNALPAHAHQH